jgi:serine/threonine-protein kinase
VIHRDVSPDNILISYDGAVKLSDFGVARARDSLHTTTAGSLKGKFSYMSPEHALGRPIDRRIDIFALGIVLFEMTTYRRLFRRKTDAESLQAVIKCQVPPPSRIIEGYPKRLEDIVLKALKKNPEDRFQSAKELQEALEDYLIQTGAVITPSMIGRLMSDVFSDRIQRRNENKSHFPQEISSLVPEIEIQTSAPITGKGSSPFGQMESIVSAVPWRQWLLCAVSLVVLVALVLSGRLWLRSMVQGRNEPLMIQASARVQIREGQGHAVPGSAPLVQNARNEVVTLSIRATPPQAVIRFDGQWVTNPFWQRRPPLAAEKEVVVSAPGCKTQRFKVSLSQGGKWEIGLKPLARAPSSPPPQRVRGLTRTASASARALVREALADDDVLNNPYQAGK